MLVAAQPGAIGARAEGVVEGKQPRLDLRHGDVAVRAGVVLRQHPLFFALGGDQNVTPRKLQRRLDGLRDAASAVLRDLQAVDDDLDAVAFLLVQLDVLLQPQDGAVDPDPGVAFFPGLGEEVFELSLFAADQGREDLHPFIQVALEDQSHDLVDGVPDDGLAALRTVRNAYPPVEQAQVVVDLRHGPHDGPGIVPRSLLLDGNGGRKPRYIVHVGFFLHAQKLPRVGGKGFHVAPLPLGVKGVEGQ